MNRRGASKDPAAEFCQAVLTLLGFHKFGIPGYINWRGPAGSNGEHLQYCVGLRKHLRGILSPKWKAFARFDANESTNRAGGQSTASSAPPPAISQALRTRFGTSKATTSHLIRSSCKHRRRSHVRHGLPPCGISLNPALLEQARPWPEQPRARNAPPRLPSHR
jgi:hypothetical protein